MEEEQRNYTVKQKKECGADEQRKGSRWSLAFTIHRPHGTPFETYAYGPFRFWFYTTRTSSVQSELCLAITDAAASADSAFYGT